MSRLQVKLCTNCRSVRRPFYNFFTSGKAAEKRIELEKINEFNAYDLERMHKKERLFFAFAEIPKPQKRGQFRLKNRNKMVTIPLQRHFWGIYAKMREQLFAVRKSADFIWKCAITLMKKLTDDLHFWVRYCIMEAQWKVVPLRTAGDVFPKRNRKPRRFPANNQLGQALCRKGGEPTHLV